jgi:hypothetical protein
MKGAFCKVPSSVVAFQGKIPATKVTPQFILARLYTWFKEVKVVVPTLTLLKKLFRHFLTLMLQLYIYIYIKIKRKRIFFLFYV